MMRKTFVPAGQASCKLFLHTGLTANSRLEYVPSWFINYLMQNLPGRGMHT
jgi:hypothetical protein